MVVIWVVSGAAMRAFGGAAMWMDRGKYQIMLVFVLGIVLCLQLQIHKRLVGGRFCYCDAYVWQDDRRLTEGLAWTCRLWLMFVGDCFLRLGPCLIYSSHTCRSGLGPCLIYSSYTCRSGQQSCVLGPHCSVQDVSQAKVIVAHLLVFWLHHNQTFDILGKGFEFWWRHDIF